MAFYIIDKNEQMQCLRNLGDCFIHFIPFNYKYHPSFQRDNISLIYIHPLHENKGYILCLEHNESMSISYKDILNFLEKNTDKLYVINKKETLYYYNVSHKLYDLQLRDNTLNSKITDWNSNNCINFYYDKYTNLPELNCIIPISKHYEVLEILYNKVLASILMDTPLNRYDNLSKVFYEIESNGISLNKDNFIEYYGDALKHPEFSIKNGKIYTQYNLNTTTGRPSNNFNGINFAALNHNTGERNCYIPENDEFVEFDYNAFHIRLLANAIKYSFDSDNIYEQLGKFYFDKEILSKEDISKAKIITFQQIYGGINTEYLEHPFFEKVNNFALNSHMLYCQNKTVLGFNFSKNENLSPFKLLNYVIQALETKYNTNIMVEIIKLLKHKKTKLVLYTYDALLFDYSYDDGEEFLKTIKILMGFPVSEKRGITYGELVKLS